MLKSGNVMNDFAVGVIMYKFARFVRLLKDSESQSSKTAKIRMALPFRVGLVSNE